MCVTTADTRDRERVPAPLCFLWPFMLEWVLGVGTWHLNRVLNELCGCAPALNRQQSSSATCAGAESSIALRVRAIHVPQWNEGVLALNKITS